MNDFIRVIRALSDPNRVKLLKILQERVMCVCEIQAALGIAQPTVSKHLKSLKMRDWWAAGKKAVGELLSGRRQQQPLRGNPPGKSETLAQG